jgi:hypothetical protein
MWRGPFYCFNYVKCQPSSLFKPGLLALLLILYTNSMLQYSFKKLIVLELGNKFSSRYSTKYCLYVVLNFGKHFSCL